jgi:hypothetical protein
MNPTRPRLDAKNGVPQSTKLAPRDVTAVRELLEVFGRSFVIVNAAVVTIRVAE